MFDESGLSITRIAYEKGYSDAVTLGPTFGKAVRVPP